MKHDSSTVHGAITVGGFDEFEEVNEESKVSVELS